MADLDRPNTPSTKATARTHESPRLTPNRPLAKWMGLAAFHLFDPRHACPEKDLKKPQEVLRLSGPPLTTL